MWTGSMLTFAGATTRVGSVYVNVVRMIAAVIFLVITVVIFQINFSVTLVQVWYLSLSGMVGFVFGDTFLFKSFEYNNARIGSLIMSASPAMAALFAYVFLNETLSPMGILGMIVTLGGIALVVLERKELSSHHTPICILYFAWRRWSSRRINSREKCIRVRTYEWICCDTYSCCCWHIYIVTFELFRGAFHASYQSLSEGSESISIDITRHIFRSISRRYIQPHCRLTYRCCCRRNNNVDCSNPYAANRLDSLS
jgi:uncharacterized membrane protein